jgi:hypothetical protein
MTSRNRNSRHAGEPENGSDFDREVSRPRPHSDDYAADDVRSVEGVPRERFGFAPPRNYPYGGVASEHRRGRFYGLGPKGYRRSDERIREEISDRLMMHPDIDASDIEVLVSRGVVTLTGTAEDRHEKRLADLIAEDVVGVDDVENQLKVRHGFWATLTGERAAEGEMPKRAERDRATVSKEAGRAASARNSARRDAEAR